MGAKLLLFTLGVLLGFLLGRPNTSPTRRLYQTVKAAEIDGIDGFGSELGSL